MQLAEEITRLLRSLCTPSGRNVSSIVTVGNVHQSRLRPWQRTGRQDFQATDGRVFVTPYDTNLAWTHEMPKSATQVGRRISITVRAFE